MAFPLIMLALLLSTVPGMAIVDEGDSGKTMSRSGGLFGNGDIKNAPVDPVLPDPRSKTPSAFLQNASYAPEPVFTLGYFGNYVSNIKWGLDWGKYSNKFAGTVSPSNLYTHITEDDYDAGIDGGWKLHNNFGIGFQAYNSFNKQSNYVAEYGGTPDHIASITMNSKTLLLKGFAMLGTTHGFNISANAYAGVSRVDMDFSQYDQNGIGLPEFNAISASYSGIAPEFAASVELGIPLGEASVRQWMQLYFGIGIKRTLIPSLTYNNDVDTDSDGIPDIEKGTALKNADGSKMEFSVTAIQRTLGIRIAF